jgi:hypothetical protein
MGLHAVIREVMAIPEGPGGLIRTEVLGRSDRMRP